MGKHANMVGGAQALPLALLAQAIPMLTRTDLERLTERLIDYLDAIDPDPEAEEIPVEDAQITYDLPPEEDDTDPDLEEIDEREPDDDDKGDPAWAEWHTLTASQKRCGTLFTVDHEDDEDDDPSGQCDEDGVNTAFDLVQYTYGADCAGDPLSDSDCSMEAD